MYKSKPESFCVTSLQSTFFQATSFYYSDKWTQKPKKQLINKRLILAIDVNLKYIF